MNKQTMIVFLLAVIAAGGAVYFFTGVTKPLPQTPVVDGSAFTAPEPSQLPTALGAPSFPVSGGRLTAAEVARHSQSNDCWMIIGSKVYDFTPYIPMHPGGQRAIIDSCGGDGTRVFSGERKHSRPDVQSQLASYLIGSL